MNRPGWLISFITVVTLSVTILASIWQFQRAEYKRGLAAEFEKKQGEEVLDLNAGLASEDVQFRSVQVKGKFNLDHVFVLDNKIRGGQAGYEVIGPLNLQGSSDVVLPPLNLPSEVVETSGMAVYPGAGALELSSETIQGVIWQNMNITEFERRFNQDIYDFIILAGVSPGVDFDKKWPKPGFGVEKHVSYAFQWIIFSLLIVFFYVYYGFFKRDEKSATKK
jgi:surfeit locus 1 family protein